MEFVEKLKDILLYKASTTMSQNTFMREFNEVYQESDKKRKRLFWKSLLIKFSGSGVGADEKSLKA